MTIVPTSRLRARRGAPSTETGRHRRWALAYAVYAALLNIGFTQAVWMNYLLLRGYDPLAIGLFETAFHVGKFLAEVPTGIFADLVGRRASLIAACVCGAISEALILVPQSGIVALSLALAGVAYAFRGGAESALLWSLAERAGSSERAERYSRLYSRMLVVGLIALTLGQSTGGYLAHVALVLPFILQTATDVLGIVPLLFLPEQRPTHASRPHPLAHLRAGVAAVAHNRLLLALLLVSAIEATLFTTVNYYTQLYFTGIGYSLAALGIIYAASSVVDFVSTATAPRIMRRIRRGRLTVALLASVEGGVMLMATGQPALALVGFLLLFHAADALIVPVISTSLNERAPETQRATVLSLDAGLFSAAALLATLWLVRRGTAPAPAQPAAEPALAAEAPSRATRESEP